MEAANPPNVDATAPLTTKQDGKAKYTTISIPQQLYQEIKKAIEGTGFRSPTEYLVYVTRTSLANPSPDLRPARPLFR